MALELYIPPCIHDPTNQSHLPPLDKPLRINIEGPLTSIQKLFPDVKWNLQILGRPYPQPAGPALAQLTYETIYKRAFSPTEPDEAKIRDEYLGWIKEQRAIDYYGITFDHRVPAGDENPEILQINVIEMDDDEGAYAREWLLFEITPDEWRQQYQGKRVLAVPRCCGKRKGTTDRTRINQRVHHRRS